MQHRRNSDAEFLEGSGALTSGGLGVGTTGGGGPAAGGGGDTNGHGEG